MNFWGKAGKRGKRGKLGKTGKMGILGKLVKVAMPLAPHTALTSDSCFAIAPSTAWLWKSWKVWKVGKNGKNGKVGESCNAFGTAHRSDERLLLCDCTEHCVVGKNGKWLNEGGMMHSSFLDIRTK